MSESAPPDVRDDVRDDIRALESANAALRGTITAHEATIADLRQRLDAPEKGPGADPLQTLSQAVEMLREDVERERDRGDRAERQVEEGRKRIDELQATLIEERGRIDGLYAELGDARTAAMISGCEAAVLRTRLELLTERRPWWRRWFR
jgi:predicted  nucleic acid-binding Zn-ribbon protein